MKIYLYIIPISLLFQACNINTTGNNNTINNTSNNIILKGTIEDNLDNTLVFLDDNHNNKLDNNEKYSYSKNGKIIIELPINSYINNSTLIAMNGYSINSNLNNYDFFRKKIHNNISTLNISTLSTIKSFNENINISKEEAEDIKLLLKIAHIYIQDNSDYINFVEDFSTNIHNNSKQLLEDMIISNTQLSRNNLNYLFREIKLEDLKLNLDLKLNIIRKNKNDFNNLVEDIKIFNSTDKHNDKINKIKLEFNKYGFNFNEKKYNFYSNIFPELNNIDLNNLEGYINSLENNKFKKFLQNIVLNDQIGEQ